jgi:hypothetical protein
LIMQHIYHKYTFIVKKTATSWARDQKQRL